MKSGRTRSNASSKPAPASALDLESRQSSDARVSRIAVSAYYKAEARGFAPGHELEDWLAAEAEEQS